MTQGGGFGPLFFVGPVGMKCQMLSRHVFKSRRTGPRSCVLIVMLFNGAVLADGARCRSIPQDAERLACYDRVFDWANRDQPIGASSSSAARTEAPTTAPVPFSADGARVPEQEPIAPTATVDEFGKGQLPAPQASVSSSEPNRVEAKVVGRIDGVTRGQAFLLDNGQRWISIDDRDFDVAGIDLPVSLRRNLIGSYWLRFETRGPQLRVRRVQ